MMRHASWRLRPARCGSSARGRTWRQPNGTPRSSGATRRPLHMPPAQADAEPPVVLARVLLKLQTEAAGPAEFAERLGLQLADPLAAEPQLLPDFAERSLHAPAVQAKPQADDVGLAGAQVRGQGTAQAGCQYALLGGLGGGLA